MNTEKRFDELSLFPHLDQRLAKQAEKDGGFRQSMLWLLKTNEGRELGDVRLVAQDTTPFIAHRCILKCRTGRWIESIPSGEITRVPGITRDDALAVFLHWVYCDKLGIRKPPEHLLRQLLAAAEALGLQALSVSCREVAPAEITASVGQEEENGGPEIKQSAVYAANIKSLLHEGEGSVVFSWEDGTNMPVHREILLARSPWHRKMFSSSWASPNLSEGRWTVQCGDLDKGQVTDFLSFVHSLSGISFLRSDDYERLYGMAEIADMFDNAELNAAVCAWLSRKLDCDTTCDLWNVCNDVPGCAAASGACLSYFCANFTEITSRQSFCQLRAPLLLSALQTGRIQGSLGTVYEAVEHWAQAQVRKDMDLREDDPVPHHAVKELIQPMLPPNTLFSSELVDRMLGREQESRRLPF